jgi:hypothetical protein
MLRLDESAGRKLLLSPVGSLNARDLALTGTATLLVGPEGGLSPGEQELAIGAGFEQVRMGPRILRTETAAIAALTILQHDFGDLEFLGKKSPVALVSRPCTVTGGEKRGFRRLPQRVAAPERSRVPAAVAAAYVGTGTPAASLD